MVIYQVDKPPRIMTRLRTALSLPSFFPKSCSMQDASKRLHRDQIKPWNGNLLQGRNVYRSCGSLKNPLFCSRICQVGGPLLIVWMFLKVRNLNIFQACRTRERDVRVFCLPFELYRDHVSTSLCSEYWDPCSPVSKKPL